MRLERVQLFWSEWVQATSQEMLDEVWGNRVFLTSIWKRYCSEVGSSCKDLHLLKCARYCLWLAPFQELWRPFSWFCCFVREVRAMCTTVLHTIKPIEGLKGPKYRALKCLLHFYHRVSRKDDGAIAVLLPALTGFSIHLWKTVQMGTVVLKALKLSWSNRKYFGQIKKQFYRMTGSEARCMSNKPAVKLS